MLSFPLRSSRTQVEAMGEVMEWAVGELAWREAPTLARGMQADNSCLWSTSPLRLVVSLAKTLLWG